MKIKKDTLVSISMTLSDENNNLIEENKDNIIYLHGGYGHIFRKLEEELMGKEIGYKFNIKLLASEAFGEIREDLISQEPLDELPSDIVVGMELDGEVDGVIYQVIEIGDTHALIDGNSPYAGMDMIAKGEVLEIEHLSPEAVAAVLEDAHEHD
jgi:FKBP-type peptidyl-prolyl cis-trans isomerase SlyD